MSVLDTLARLDAADRQYQSYRKSDDFRVTIVAPPAARTTTVRPEPEVTPADPYAICGDCYYPAHAHPVSLEYESCYRPAHEVGTRSFDFSDEGHRTPVDLDRYGNPAVDYSGPAFGRETDSWSVTPDVLDTADWERIDQYSDAKPDERTYAIDWYHEVNGRPVFGDYSPERIAEMRKSLPTNVEPRSRSAYVEGNDGFFTEQVMDFGLTVKYHNRLLNVFTDSHGSLRVGSIRIVKCADGSVRAECVQNACSGYLTALNPTVTEMEDFTLAVIRHGNNHAARWLKERNTFYKIHSASCDTDCNPVDNICNENAKVLDYDEALARLGEYLAESYALPQD